MPETKKPKAAVSTPDEPLVQADWDEARRTRPHEFLPGKCVLNENAAQEAEDSHRQTPPVSESDQAKADQEKGQAKAEERDAMRRNSPQVQNAPVQPKPVRDSRSDNEVVRAEGLNAPREEAVKHESKP